MELVSVVFFCYIRVEHGGDISQSLVMLVINQAVASLMIIIGLIGVVVGAHP